MHGQQIVTTKGKSFYDLKSNSTAMKPHRLERLELGYCGRGFGDAQAEILSKGGPLTSVATLALGGAYRLSDSGLERVGARPSLLKFPILSFLA